MGLIVVLAEAGNEGSEDGVGVHISPGLIRVLRQKM